MVQQWCQKNKTCHTFVGLIVTVNSVTGIYDNSIVPNTVSLIAVVVVTTVFVVLVFLAVISMLKRPRKYPTSTNTR